MEITKSNTVQHQNMSKKRHQNGTKKKNNNTSFQMLLDHCYTFGLLLLPSNSEVVLWRRALIDLIMALPWIHHCADLTQKSIQMCGSHEYSQMLVDNCYAFSLLLQHSTLKEQFFGEGPLIDILWPCSGSAPLCLIQAFATTSCFRNNLILKFKAFALYSHSIQVFATTTDCSSRNKHTAS